MRAGGYKLKFNYDPIKTNNGDPINFINGLKINHVPIENIFQETLVSSVNIKTINGQSLLGSGNLVLPTITDSLANIITLEGPDTCSPETSVNFNITNYHCFSKYKVRCTEGTVTIARDVITFTAPSNFIRTTITVFRDGIPYSFTLLNADTILIDSDESNLVRDKLIITPYETNMLNESTITNGTFTMVGEDAIFDMINDEPLELFFILT